MQTGENIQALRKIMDFTRLASLLMLAIHFYLYSYGAFHEWGWTAPLIDKVITPLSKLPLFKSELLSKAAAILLLAISQIGVKGRKEEKINKESVIAYLITGVLIYALSHLCLSFQSGNKQVALFYIVTTLTGYLLILTGASRLSRLIKITLGKDIFNNENETFPQHEQLIENEFSVNLPAQYILKGKVRQSWINFINLFRGLLVIGTPGAGKTYFVIRHVIEQHIKKGFSMFLYDFKFDDLSRIAYNALLKYYKNYKVKPRFYTIDLDNPKYRCNPLDPESMEDITDATEASRTIMLGLNKDWIRKQGDFFVESPINFVTAVIWYLRKYKDGIYCTLPHVIELIQTDYEQLFPVLQMEPEIEVLINPFISAFINDATDQLEGQIASAKISLGRLASPKLYYVLTGNDFTLDINNPEAPKIVCVGNNPQKIQTYGAVLSLYVSRMIKLVNRKGQLKSSLIFDEFPTIYLNNIDGLMATARSNKVATTLGIQDYSQLKKDYGREQAEVIMNIVGNVISGQVTGDTAKQLSERFGKINQVKESLSINSMDTSVSKSTQLDYAIPASKISTLSSGEFVGMVADEPTNKIDLKIFHNEIINDHEAIKKEEAAYQPLPKIREVSEEEIMENYNKVKTDIMGLIEEELARRNPAGAIVEPKKLARGQRKQPQKKEKRSLSL
ncbi:MAG: conjugal transfer protein MobC [Mucilaginibacter sp.]|uniref:conjugal transfer protein MobC n=1 Tax=Mucilaginibacter sp. TaxID=1882438 RepID=UPI00326311EE